jgi:mannitol/fructose-specific phosphotransferase system IIA component (Ntr-type)
MILNLQFDIFYLQLFSIGGVMIKLSDFCTERTIRTGLVGKKKKEAIAELVGCLAEAGLVTDEQGLLKAVLAREKIQSTGLGGGVAIPHARAGHIRRIVMAVGRSEEGVDFSALDNKPVHLVFLVAAPDESARPYIQTVAKVARLLKTPPYKDLMLMAADSAGIARLIEEFDQQHPGEVRVSKTKDGRVIHPE